VADQDRGFRGKVVTRLVGRDLDVLVFDDDLFAPLPEPVLLEPDRLPGVEPDFPALFRRLELDLEVGPG
jgi:hypothetical protein